MSLWMSHSNQQPSLEGARAPLPTQGQAGKGFSLVGTKPPHCTPFLIWGHENRFHTLDNMPTSALSLTILEARKPNSKGAIDLVSAEGTPPGTDAFCLLCPHMLGSSGCSMACLSERH